MTYTVVVTHLGRYAVALPIPGTGQFAAVLDCPTERAAHEEAARLNAQRIVRGMAANSAQHLRLVHA